VWVGYLWGEVNFIRSVVSPVVEKHYPSKANHEKMSLYDLIAFGVMAHKHFDGVYKRAYRVLIEGLKLFPKV
jgi:coproporphyrinogen III oxidase-like Fe-S oxidoreductase